jgi:hypothetical protein
VTVADSAYQPGTLRSTTSGWATVLTSSITTTGQPVFVTTYGNQEKATILVSGYSSSVFAARFRLVRDNVLLQEAYATTIDGTGSIPAQPTFAIRDIPNAGPHIYYLQIYTAALPSGYSYSLYPGVTYASLLAMEVKR